MTSSWEWRGKARLALLALAVVAAWAVCGDARADTLCTLHGDQAWPDTTLYVSGVEVSGTAVVTTEPDGSEKRCVDVAGLIPPYAVTAVTCNAAGCTDGVLLSGRPQPLMVWPSRACRYDANEDGAVGLDDAPPFLGAVWGVEVCGG